MNPMERTHNCEMKIKRFAYWFIGFSVVVIIWKLCIIESNLVSLQSFRKALELQEDQLELTQQQIVLFENWLNKKNNKKLPTIYAVTPTYWRFVQKAELTRISQTLRLVPNVHWIVVEDSETKTELVRNLIVESGLVATHLNAKTPPFEQLQSKEPRWKRHRGVEQRNTALKWFRDTLIPNKDKGIVYFMDDDNTYNVKVFDEMAKIKKVGVWPVGLVGGLNAESPILDEKTGTDVIVLRP
jgi:galactosylgalactosylxylosylprotein 3-beta-glucuronosyltransferase 3